MQDRYGHLDENLLQRTAGPYIGSEADLTAPKSNVRFTPESGLKSDIAPCPKSAITGSRRVDLISAEASD